MKFKEEIEIADLVDNVTNSQSFDLNINYTIFADILIKAKQNNLPVKKKKKKKKKIVPSLTIIINQSLEKGTFPEKLLKLYHYLRR